MQRAVLAVAVAGGDRLPGEQHHGIIGELVRRRGDLVQDEGAAGGPGQVVELLQRDLDGHPRFAKPLGQELRPAGVLGEPTHRAPEEELHLVLAGIRVQQGVVGVDAELVLVPVGEQLLARRGQLVARPVHLGLGDVQQVQQVAQRVGHGEPFACVRALGHPGQTVRQRPVEMDAGLEPEVLVLEGCPRRDLADVREILVLIQTRRGVAVGEPGEVVGRSPDVKIVGQAQRVQMDRHDQRPADAHRSPAVGDRSARPGEGTSAGDGVGTGPPAGE